MAGVLALGECMVELSLAGTGAALGYAGDTFNTAIYMRRLGLEVAFATAVGAGDPFSRGILEALARDGVSRDLVVEARGRLPGLYAIERDDRGERSFFYWRDQSPARDYMTLMDRDALRAAMAGAELVYLSAISLAILGEAGRAALMPMLREVADAGGEIAFDTNYRARLWPDAATAGAAMAAVAPLARRLSISVGDGEAFGHDAAGFARTCAARGAEVVLRHEDQAIEVMVDGRVDRVPPGPSVAVVDTTGAGDSFNAAYLWARMRGRAPAEAVAAGRQLASVVVQHPGAILPPGAMPAIG